jgi:hypothetical protein
MGQGIWKNNVNKHFNTPWLISWKSEMILCRRSAGQSVLVSGIPLGSMTFFLFPFSFLLSDNFSVLHLMGRPLRREDGSVICSAVYQWSGSRRTHNHIYIYIYINTQTPWSESASELYRPSDNRLSEKWLPTFADKGCHVVSVTDPYGRILCFLDRSRYFSIK